jgi:hypothetical protein
MRGIFVATGLAVLAIVGSPARASDDTLAELPALGSLNDDVLQAMSADFVSALPLSRSGQASAEQGVLSATSTVDGAVTNSTIRAGVDMASTGAIMLGDVSGAAGGITSIQLSTGFNNVQQSSAAVVIAF